MPAHRIAACHFHVVGVGITHQAGSLPAGGGRAMATVGLIAIIVVALVVLAGLVAAAVSIPDVRRYRRIRNM
jgi:hypothetical protein